MQEQNNNLYSTLNALTGNISESFKTINLLQQENTRLNEAARTHEAHVTNRWNDLAQPDAGSDYPQLGCQETPLPVIPLIDRIGDRIPIEEETRITFPSISNIPIIREGPVNPPLVRRISDQRVLVTAPYDPLPPQRPPTTHAQDRRHGFQGEGVRRAQVSFAWSADQWRSYDKEQKINLKGVRRNDQDSLDIGDVYTYAFIMRTLHGQDSRKHTPRSVKRRAPRSWSLVESSFVRAVIEVVLEPGLGLALEAIRTTARFEGHKPGTYLTDAITMDQEFPLDLAAELLVQNGATEQWFNHRWTTAYATSYLSEWGVRNYPKLANSRIAKTYRQVFSPISSERRDPFTFKLTSTLTEDEARAHQPLTETMQDQDMIGGETTLEYAAEDEPNEPPNDPAEMEYIGNEFNIGSGEWVIY
jgi:hypothetical protein